MKIIIIFFGIVALLSNCNNSKVEVVQKSDSIVLKLPNCKDYSFVNYKKVNNDIVVNMNCMCDYFDPIAEREYFLYIIKNLIPYFERENIDSVRAIYTYPTQNNRIMDFSFSASLLINANKEKDSINRPIYFKIVEKVINDSDFRFKTVCFEYDYGKASQGKSYEFYNVADVFGFYLSINDEVLYTHKRENLKVLVKLLHRHEEREYQEFIHFLMDFYPKPIVDEELQLYKK